MGIIGSVLFFIPSVNIYQRMLLLETCYISGMFFLRYYKMNGLTYAVKTSSSSIVCSPNSSTENSWADLKHSKRIKMCNHGYSHIVITEYHAGMIIFAG